MDRTGNDGWAEDDVMGLWEHQGAELTVKDLGDIFRSASPDLPVVVEHYDGEGGVQAMTPMHVDLRGRPGAPTALVITVV